jgi:hypothetical protein
MGLQCSILGHSFEPAGVEREREEQGSEVVTTEREIEQCRRCGAERVVSESTEVTTVVDGEAVGLETGDEAETEGTSEDESDGGGIASALERSDLEGDDEIVADERSSPESVDDTTTSPTAGDAGSPTPEEPGTSEATRPGNEQTDSKPSNPESEDAEILTDDDGVDREPGQWPEAMDSDEDEEPDPVVDIDSPVEEPDEESLSGITVPEGEIVCPECGFRVDANSGYRDGDPCPECNAWLEAERNQ